MRLFLLTTLTMIAFAGNSVLNRLALADASIGPAAFAAVRLGTGALALIVLAGLTGQLRMGGVTKLWGAGALALYMIGFSYAYLTLDTGLGALILFGGVQITMFAGALLMREDLPVQRWIGAALALGGLAVLLWPSGEASISIIGAGLMAAAALGWGVYSLIGRGSQNPLGDTAISFLFALPLALILFAVVQDGMTVRGVVLATLSGVVTSACGYALWYTVLPKLESSLAAIAQLTVPVLAAIGGMVFLGEALTLRFLIATALVLGGVVIASRQRR